MARKKMPKLDAITRVIARILTVAEEKRRGSKSSKGPEEGKKSPVAFMILPAGFSLTEKTNEDWTKARKTLHSCLSSHQRERKEKKKKRGNWTTGNGGERNAYERNFLPVC